MVDLRIPRWLWLCLLACYLVPSFWWFDLEATPVRLRQTRPHVISGDEPHYLVMLSSLVRDGDLHVRNNYERAQAGYRDAGRSFRGARLDSENHLHHLPGHVVPLALLLWPLRWTGHLESGALLAQVAVGFLLLFILVRALRTSASSGRTPDRWALFLSFLAVAVASPVWYYGTRFFAEIELALVLLGTVLLTERNRTFWAGCLVGWGACMKPPVLVVLLPLFLVTLSTWRLRSAACLLAGPVFGLVAIGVTFWHRYGSPFTTPLSGEIQRFSLAIVPRATWGLLFDTRHGLIPFWPLAPVSVAGLWFLAKDRPRRALLVVGASASYFSVFVFYRVWSGGVCYAARYLVPLVPILALGIPPLLTRAGPWGRRAVGLLVLFGFLTNFQALAAPRAAMDSTPFHMLYQGSSEYAKREATYGPNELYGYGRADRDGKEPFREVGPQDPAGFFVYGPYRRYRGGRYEAVFDVTVAGGEVEPEEAVLHLDVNAHLGLGQLVSRTLTGADLKEAIPVRLIFEVPGGRTGFLPYRNPRLEFRVYHYGWATVRFRSVRVRPLE